MSSIQAAAGAKPIASQKSITNQTKLEEKKSPPSEGLPIAVPGAMSVEQINPIDPATLGSKPTQNPVKPFVSGYYKEEDIADSPNLLLAQSEVKANEAALRTHISQNILLSQKSQELSDLARENPDLRKWDTLDGHEFITVTDGVQTLNKNGKQLQIRPQEARYIRLMKEKQALESSPTVQSVDVRDLFENLTFSLKKFTAAEMEAGQAKWDTQQRLKNENRQKLLNDLQETAIDRDSIILQQSENGNIQGTANLAEDQTSIWGKTTLRLEIDQLPDIEILDEELHKNMENEFKKLGDFFSTIGPSISNAAFNGSMGVSFNDLSQDETSLLTFGVNQLLDLETSTNGILNGVSLSTSVSVIGTRPNYYSTLSHSTFKLGEPTRTDLSTSAKTFANLTVTAFSPFQLQDVEIAASVSAFGGKLSPAIRATFGKHWLKYGHAHLDWAKPLTGNALDGLSVTFDMLGEGYKQLVEDYPNLSLLKPLKHVDTELTVEASGTITTRLKIKSS